MTSVALHVRTAVEQAIARGLTAEQAAEHTGTTLDEVAEVVARMDEAAASAVGNGRYQGGGVKRTPSHGDVRGYEQHRRDKTAPCDACDKAYRAYGREYRARKRGAA